MRTSRKAVLAMAAPLTIAAPIWSAHAQQSVGVFAGAAQRAPDASVPDGYRDTPLPGCSDGRGSGGTPASVAASFSCMSRGATLSGSSSAAFGGPLGVAGGITGGLTAQPPGFNNLTVTSGVARLDDRLLFAGTGVTPASFSLLLRVTGGSVVRDLSADGQAYTQGFVGLITPGLPSVAFPWGAPSIWGAYVNFESDGALVRTAGPAAFGGTHVRTVTGTTSTYATDGQVTFGGIPVLPGGSTAFAVMLQFGAVVWNSGGAAATVADEASFDYGRVSIAGVRVFDAAGNDITEAARPMFGSGASLAVVPEPGTLALVGAGLVGAWVTARRRRPG